MMVKYTMYKGKRKICKATFSEEGMKHLRTSGYAKKKGVSFVKCKRKRR